MKNPLKKILLTTFVLFVGIFILVISSLLYITYPWNVDALPTASNIDKIKIGMNKLEVISILGTPYSDKISDGIVGQQKGKTTITYSRFTMKNYPHLWVHFKDDVVIEVYAKEYPHFGDDNAVYSLSSRTKSNFTKPLFYIIF